MKQLPILFFLISGALSAQPAVIKNFTLMDVTKGTPVSLDQYSSASGIVVLFTSNECPYDLYYTDRLTKLVADFSGRVTFLLINSHDGPEEGDERMKTKAATWAFTVPYLADKSQVAMTELGARRSPEVFLLKPGKDGFQVFYTGGIDDNPQEPTAVTSQWLRDAIQDLLSGKPAKEAPVRSPGCSIRKK
jgi:hypothetical protein